MTVTLEMLNGENIFGNLYLTSTACRQIKERQKKDDIQRNVGVLYYVERFVLSYLQLP